MRAIGDSAAYALLRTLEDEHVELGLRLQNVCDRFVAPSRADGAVDTGHVRFGAGIRGTFLLLP